MTTAPLGDDALDGDPTARELEETCTRLLGKEAALFTPSCTMANLLAVLTQLSRGQQLVLEADAHMYVMERERRPLPARFMCPSAARMDRWI